MKNLIISLCFIFLAAGSQNSIAANDAVAQQTLVQAIAIAKPRPGTFEFSGTKITLSVTTPTPIITIDPTTTKLTSFIDDKGTDLLAAGIQWRSQQSDVTSRTENGFDVAVISIHENSALVPVSVTATPSPGAKMLTISGTIGLVVAPAVNTAAQDSGLIKIDSLFATPITFGNNTVTIAPFGTGEADGVFNHYANISSTAVLARLTLYDEKQTQLLTFEKPNPNENLVIESRLIPNIKAIRMLYTTPDKTIIPVNITTGIGF